MSSSGVVRFHRHEICTQKQLAIRIVRRKTARTGNFNENGVFLAVVAMGAWHERDSKIAAQLQKLSTPRDEGPLPPILAEGGTAATRASQDQSSTTPRTGYLTSQKDNQELSSVSWGSPLAAEARNFSKLVRNLCCSHLSCLELCSVNSLS